MDEAKRTTDDRRAIALASREHREANGDVAHRAFSGARTNPVAGSRSEQHTVPGRARARDPRGGGLLPGHFLFLS